jgi:hypothetical protein
VSQTPVTVGRHQATRDTVATRLYIEAAVSTAHDTACTVTIGLRPVSSVTVAVSVDFHSATDPCPIALRAAALVEPHLPYPDRCVIGSWRPGGDTENGQLDGRSVRLAGRGAPVTFRPDGTGEQDYGDYPGGTAYTVSGGATGTYVLTGTVTFHWDTENGVLIFGGASGEVGWKLAGTDRAGSVSPNPPPARYLCSAHRLLILPTRVDGVVSLSRQ